MHVGKETVGRYPKDFILCYPVLLVPAQVQIQHPHYIGKGTSFGSCLREITICRAANGTSSPAAENRQVDGTEGGREDTTHV